MEGAHQDVHPAIWPILQDPGQENHSNGSFHQDCCHQYKSLCDLDSPSVSRQEFLPHFLLEYGLNIQTIYVCIKIVEHHEDPERGKHYLPSFCFHSVCVCPKGTCFGHIHFIVSLFELDG